MKRAKYYILLILLLLAGGWAKAQQWKELHTGVTEDLYDICCIDTNNVLACGQNGVIVKTTDGGQTWEQINSNTNTNLHLLRFANGNIGFACGDDTFLKTTDGGNTWTKMETNPEIGFNYSSSLSQTNLFLVDADTLYITDSHNDLWKSSDGGENFEKVLDHEYNMYLEYYYRFDMFFEDNVGYLVGYDVLFLLWPLPNLTVFKTSDYGKTWEIIEFAECGGNLSAVHFTDKNHFRFYGYFSTSPEEYYSIMETTDGMESYSLLVNVEELAGFPDPWNLGDFIAFSSEETGCMVYNLASYNNTTAKEQSDFCSYALLTQDNGETWTSVPDGINWRNHLYAVDGVDTVFYIAASDGYVYKTGIADVIYPYGVDESISEISVFPNPASEMIHINGIEVAELNIYNTVGQLVKTARSCNEINVSDLPKGIYMLQVKDACGNRHWAKVTVK